MNSPLVTKSSEFSWFFCKGRVSKPYIRIGVHLLEIICKMTSSGFFKTLSEDWSTRCTSSVLKNVEHSSVSCSLLNFKRQNNTLQLIFFSECQLLCRNKATFQNSKTNLSRKDSLTTFTSSLVKFHPKTRDKRSVILTTFWSLRRGAYILQCKCQCQCQFL